MDAMKQFSLMMFPWGVEPPKVEELIAAAQHAEELGFYSVSIPQHLTLPTGWIFQEFPNQDVIDPLVLLPAIAATTKSIRVGPNSVLLPLLPPYAWAKYLASLDVITGGRVIAGVAMGWWEEEFRVVEVDRRLRGKLFDEQLEMITRLWVEDRVTFKGRFYQLDDAPLEPKPVQKPYPPIWMGGGVHSIERAARYAEYIVPFWPTSEEARNVYIPRLREAGERWGTQPKLMSFNFIGVAKDEENLRRDILPQLKKCVTFENPDAEPEDVAICGMPEQCAQRIKAVQEAGSAHFLIDFNCHGLESVQYMVEQMDLFKERVVPLL